MNQPQWDHLQRLLCNRLEDSQERLEMADKTNFRFEQGRLNELRFLLELENTAKAVLGKTQTRANRTSSVTTIQ